MENCRLRVKIGPYEMEAEGPRDFVEKHYGSFSEKIPQPTQLATRPDSSPVPTPLPNAEAADAPPIAAIFHQESNGRFLSLTAKPPADAGELGAVLVLLLGHKEIRGIDLVSADELLYGLKQSGYSVDRADRIVARGEEQGLITKSGIRRGTRYRLTNQGAIAARSYAQENFESSHLKQVRRGGTPGDLEPNLPLDGRKDRRDAPAVHCVYSTTTTNCP